MVLRVVQWATGGRRRGDQGCARAPRPRTRRLLGALGSQERQGRRRTHRRRTAGSHRDQQRRRDPGARRRRRDLRAAACPTPTRSTALLRSGKNVVSPVGWFYPGETEAAPLRAAALEGGVTLHGTGIAPGGGQREVPAAALGDVHRRDIRSRRGVLRPAHLRRARRAALRDGLRRHAGQGAERPHAEAARRRLHPVGADVRRPAGLRRRPEDPHLAGDRGGHRSHRFADGGHRARAGGRPHASTGRPWSATRWSCASR